VEGRPQWAMIWGTNGPGSSRLIVAINFDTVADSIRFHEFVSEVAALLEIRTGSTNPTSSPNQKASEKQESSEERWRTHSQLKWDFTEWTDDHSMRYSIVYRSLESSVICRRYNVPPYIYDIIAKMEVLYFDKSLPPLANLNEDCREDVPGGCGTLEYRFSKNFDTGWREERRRFFPSTDAIRAHNDPATPIVVLFNDDNMAHHNKNLPPGRRNVGPWMRYQLGKLEQYWAELDQKEEARIANANRKTKTVKKAGRVGTLSSWQTSSASKKQAASGGTWPGQPSRPLPEELELLGRGAIPKTNPQP